MTETGYNRRNSFVDRRDCYRSQSFVNGRWCVHLQSRILGPKYMLPRHCLKKQLELSQDMKSRREHAPNMMLHRIHIEPISIIIHAASRIDIPWHSLNIKGPAHELTNHIRHPSPAPGQRSPGAPGKRLRMWCGMVPVSPTGTTASFPKTLWMSCIQVCIRPESQRIPSSLPKHIWYDYNNSCNNYNSFKNMNNGDN